MVETLLGCPTIVCFWQINEAPIKSKVAILTTTARNIIYDEK
jgi:hypothetical protein